MELKYILYITINLCNGKFYIGVHKTNPNVFDGYIGNGVYRANQAVKDTAFQRAVRKYGYENFRRTILRIFPDTEEGKQQAYALEAELVTETLLKSKTSYNTSIGGYGNPELNEKKTVYQFDLKGNYLRSYESAMTAALSLEVENTISAQHAIRNNCRGVTSSSYNFVWSYKKEFVSPTSKRQQIAQYTLSGKFLRYFDSITEAEACLNLTSIQQAIAKNYQCGSFQWRFYSGDTSDITPLVNLFTKNQVLPIQMYDKKGTLVAEFESVKECVVKYPNLTTTQINRVLTGKIKSHKGFVFKYKDNDIV